MEKKTKWLIATISAITAAVCLVFGGKLSITDTKAEEYILTDIKSTYSIGETLIINEEANIDVGGTSLKGENPKFVMPNGVVYGGGTYVLTQPGEYQLYYFADYQSKEISASKTIIVNEYSWAYAETSHAEYGTLTRQERITGQEDRVAEGIILDLAKGDTFTFAKKRNIAGLKELEVCQIYPDLRTETTDEASVSLVSCKIVDSYNPDIFVEVYVWAEPTGVFYMGAGASHQPIGGLLNRKETGNVTFEGAKWSFVQGTRYARGTQYGKVACYQPTANTQAFADFGGMKCTFDLETNRVYLTNRMTGEDLITDLDSPELYGDNLFQGFTSEEVYAVIQCQYYVAPSINLQIENLLGFKGEELRMVEVSDTKAPEVALTAEKTDEGGVYVVKGQEYVIPMQFEVADASYNNDMKVNVYYNYGTSRQTLVYSKNGKFTPTKDGRYTVEYKATDIYGNWGVDTLDLIVVEGNKGIAFEETKLDKLVLLQENIFPQITATGMNKEITCEVYVKAPDGEKTLLGNRLAYTPVQVGEYEIVYTFKDNVYTSVYSYKLTTTAGNSSFIQKEQPQLPVYFIKDANYAFAPLYVQTIGADGLEKKETSIQISVDGAEYKTVDTAKTVKIEGNSCVHIKYTYGDEEVGVYERAILDVNYANKTGRTYTSYFQGDYARATTASVGFEYAFAGAKDTEQMSYANLVSFANFKLAFNVAQEKDNFKKINVILQEAANPNNVLTIGYEKTEKDVVYTVKEIHEGFEVVNQTVKGMGVMAATRSISYASGVIVNENGDMVQLTPFETDLCILTIQLEGITAESSIKINELCNQKFARSYREQGAMLAVELPSRYYKLNEVYYLKPAGLSSVANTINNNDITLTVTSPNGEIAKDSEGVILENVPANKEYYLPLTVPGNYHFSYNYSYEINTGVKKEQTPMLLTVTDTVAPEAHFVGLGNEDLLTVKVGHTHKIRDYVVTDNATKAEDMWVQVSVYSSSGTMLSVNRETYTFTKAGYYKVYLWCADSDGNVATAYYNILVE